MKDNMRNRKYIYEKRYDLNNADQMFRFDQDIMSLTRRSARLSVIVGSNNLIVHVFCKMETSNAALTARRLGFELF